MHRNLLVFVPKFTNGPTILVGFTRSVGIRHWSPSTLTPPGRRLFTPSVTPKVDYARLSLVISTLFYWRSRQKCNHLASSNGGTLPISLRSPSNTQETEASVSLFWSPVADVTCASRALALQYAMRDRLIALGRSEIEVIDDDLGRSAAGGVQRAGFERSGLAGSKKYDIGDVARRGRADRNGRPSRYVVLELGFLRIRLIFLCASAIQFCSAKILSR